ncbi:3',5'-cyclic adenosine monophosphate phosphodiesterase CpdA [Rubripirellula amarantea]|uniref:3',5'-cyclic adenosine monophosphate phosphodiesterase CpdA n=1 Tax=Rubripirellula amarantea TaxID=2527999 RepID=A0A5C5WIU5_9BACT|nr:metallophosphoesterase [Rubripirellula amarantea]TWT50668.1 3',5'-cyclic adenosine monophosphate phosphodiesterase CpdA [Rubripirellula amarantea]
MSLHLPGSRRSFLQTAVGVGAIAIAGRSSVALDSQSDESYVFFSDTHICGDKTKIVSDANMFANLSRAIDEVLALPQLPRALFVNGDCAYLKGLAEDYATFASEIRRVSQAGIDLHMTMGNHDDRGPFANALSEHARQSPVQGKHVSIIEGQHVNWFLIDSLQIVDNVTGEIGNAQRKWLAEALDRHSDKPAIVMGHHNPQYLPEGSSERVTGLVDTAELVDVFHAHANVKAYIYGHTHHWKMTETAGKVHLVNLPPTAYVFNKTMPNGWVHAKVDGSSLSMTMHAFDDQHPTHLGEHRLAFR